MVHTPGIKHAHTHTHTHTVSSMSFGREDPVMKLVHAQMKSFLNLEQEAMENRIM